MRTLKSFYIRAERADFKTELIPAWAEKDTLPQEWEAVKQDETVVQAQVFHSSQRSRQHQKRRILDSYNA